MKIPFLLALSFCLLFTGHALAQVDYDAHMYLSVAPDHYDCGLAEPLWDSGAKYIYVVVDDTTPTPGEAYNAVEYKLTYPPALFIVETVSPHAPNALILEHFLDGQGNVAMGTGGPVEVNPWLAMRHQFLKFGPGENLVFTLGPNDTPSPRIGDNPGYAIYDPNDPPLFAANRVPEGSGADHKPDWRAGVVLLNYNPASLDPAVEEDLAERVQHPGHCLWMGAVSNETQSWGSLKSSY